MRFAKDQRHSFEDTHLKRLAALRRQQRERDSLPLFAAEIAAKQPTVERVMADRAENWQDHQAKRRNHRAAQWRQGRARLASYEPDTKIRVLAYWNSHKWLPGTPGYFLDMLHSIETVRLVWQGDTFRFARLDPDEALQIEPTDKPPVLLGLVRQKPQAGGMQP